VHRQGKKYLPYSNPGDKIISDHYGSSILTRQKKGIPYLDEFSQAEMISNQEMDLGRIRSWIA